MGNNSVLTFFVLPGLHSFDGIIGDDTLKSLRALVDRDNNCLIISPGIKIPLLARRSLNVYPLLDAEHPEDAKRIPPPGDAVETAVRAEIRTSTDNPMYSKTYPYPANMRDEVDRQVKELLDGGIIRPSNSPYNSPVWIVPKKPKPNGEKQYRLVIDFKRLNSITISDTYQIPDITSTLASLGERNILPHSTSRRGFIKSI